MRVLHIFTNPHLTNGASIFEYRLSRLLKDKDIFFDYLVTEQETDEERARYEAEGSKIYHLDADNKHGLAVREIKLNRQYRKFFREHCYDIVYCDTENALRAIHLMMAKKAGVPVRVVHSHNSSMQTESKVSRILSRVIKHFFKYSATDYLACSEVAAKWLFPGKIYKNKQYRLINNGIDAESFAFSREWRRIIREKYGISDSDMVVGSVARFMPQKNHAFMFRIIEEIKKTNPSVKLLCVGEGDLKGQLCQLAEELGIEDNVIFAGTAPDVNRYYSAMDVYLMTSLFEGLGISALEAQASGLPCVLSDNIPHAVDMGKGVTFVSLEEEAAVWAGCVTEEFRERHDGEISRGLMREKGYTIESTAGVMYELYSGWAARGNKKC